MRSSDRNLKTSQEVNDVKQIEICEEDYAKNQFYADFYAASMNDISHILHPYFDGNKMNDVQKSKEDIEQQIYKIETIVQECGIKDKYNLLKKAQNQIDDLVEVVGEWNKIVDSKIKDFALTNSTEKWFRNSLLPKTYWKMALEKTKYKPTQIRIKEELLKCNINEQEKPILDKEEHERLKNEAKNLCRKFQRTSSQVEGRNGYLSMINHNQRGFDENRLKVLTIIHNFDIRGLDGETPAQRLFGNAIKHDKIIDYLMEHFGHLPLPRKRNTQHIDN